jgi:adenylate cyclase
VALGERVIATDAQDRALIDHRGPAGTIARVSLGDLLSGAQPPGGFAGRAVFIGATAQSLGDVGATPLDPDTPGVESLAAAAAQIIEGRGLDDGPLASLATLVVAAAAAVAMRAAVLGVTPDGDAAGRGPVE